MSDDSTYRVVEIPSGRTVQYFGNRGKARVVELGFDTDRIRRTVTLELDPPMECNERVTFSLGAHDDRDLPVPIDDDAEREMIEFSANSIGYELVWE